jgi:hypothetical protein
MMVIMLVLGCGGSGDQGGRKHHLSHSRRS